MTIHTNPDHWTVSVSVWVRPGVYAVTLDSGAILNRDEALSLYRTLKRKLGRSCHRVALWRASEKMRDGFVCDHNGRGRWAPSRSVNRKTAGTGRQ